MRILAITRRFPTPHLDLFAPHNERQFAELARRHDVRVICPVPWTSRMQAVLAGPGEQPRSLWPERAEALHPTYCCPPGIWTDDAGTIFERSVCSAARSLMRAYQPDVILASWAHPDGTAAVRLGQQIGTPVVLRVAGDLPPNTASRRGDRIVQDLCSADALVASGAGLARRVVALGAPSHRVHVVPEGVSREQFYPGDMVNARRGLRLPEGDKIILFVGDLKAEEGATDLVKACAIIRDRGVPFRCQFVANTLETSRIRTVIHSRGLDDRMCFAGVRSHAELADWLRACDVVARPSYSNALSNVLREAMECGKPFVATRVGGVSEISHPSYSRLVIAGAVGQLADALVDMLERSPAVPADLAERVNLTWEHSTALFAHHLQAVVARRVAMRMRRVRSDLSIRYARTSRQEPLRGFARTGGPSFDSGAFAKN